MDQYILLLRKIGFNCFHADRRRKKKRGMIAPFSVYGPVPAFQLWSYDYVVDVPASIGVSYTVNGIKDKFDFYRGQPGRTLLS